MIQSSGVIVIDWGPDVPVALCVRAYANWDFPKGRVEPGESLVQAAARELQEETSIAVGTDARLTGAQAPSITYGKGSKAKTASYFLADRTSNMEPFLPVSPELGKPENDEYRWVSVLDLHSIMPGRLSPVVDYVVAWTERRTEIE